MIKIIGRIWNSRFYLGLLIFSCMTMTIIWVLAFEHLGGYIPCYLCLQQRLPYYAGIPVAFVSVVGIQLEGPQRLICGTFVTIGLLMICSMVLGIYHSGLEWGLWAGPAQCAASMSETAIPSAENLLNQLSFLKPPSCDKAMGRFLGLSFAGWNVISSMSIAFMAFRGAIIRQGNQAEKN